MYSRASCVCVLGPSHYSLELVEINLFVVVLVNLGADGFPIGIGNLPIQNLSQFVKLNKSTAIKIKKLYVAQPQLTLNADSSRLLVSNLE